MLEFGSAGHPACAAESTPATCEPIQMTLVRNCKAGGTELSATQQRSSETTATPAQRVARAILILITLYICYFSHLGVIGFVGPDEPRYAWIARDMAETGDWVTPRLYGNPSFSKT